MIDIDRKKIIESIQNEPEAWANLIVTQDKLINEYERQLLDCRARLEFLLKDENASEH